MFLEPEAWPAPFDSSLPETLEESVGCLALTPAEGPIDQLIARVGNLHRLIRIAGWAQRFVNNMRVRVRDRKAKEAAILGGSHSMPKNVPDEPQVLQGRRQDASELIYARYALIRVAQRAAFFDEFNQIAKGRQVRRESRLLTLAPYVGGDGLLRVGGRLQNSPVTEGTRHPIILEPKSPLTYLIIRLAHFNVMHRPADRTHAEVRAQYWVLRGRETVKSVIAKCFYCARRRSRPPQPQMAPLPSPRVTPGQRPFTSTGIDYFGPLTVVLGRRTEKRWGALFTCLATRAVHIEVANSLDADSFLMAFARFVDRRGAPSIVYSDNGTNLRAGERELKEAVVRLNENRVPDQLARKEIRWVFSPPAAPHFGGVWERLVRSCKEALRAVVLCAVTRRSKKKR